MRTLGLLRDIAECEVDLMLKWRNEPNIRANMYTQHQIGREEHHRWWRSVLDVPTKRYFMYEFCGKPSGIVSFDRIDACNENAFWAFYAAPDAIKGCGARMEYLALEYAFSEIKLHKLQCEVFAFNRAVIKLHTKFGFKEEGCFRQQYKVNNNFFDVYRMGLLKSDWLEFQPKMKAKLSDAI